MRRHCQVSQAATGELEFVSPYDPMLVMSLKAKIPHTDRRWDPDEKLWRISPRHAATLAELVLDCTGEQLQLPQITNVVTNVTQLLKVLYIGTPKARADGTVTAYGWVDGAWRVIFPLTVLQTWFSIAPETARTAPEATLYAVLGVAPTVTGTDLKTAYRRAARTWHPDVCTEPDATEQFQRIQRAYEILSNPLQRRKYDAGLALQATLGRAVPVANMVNATTWRSPLRCGWILVQGIPTLNGIQAEKILGWEDIVSDRNQVLVTTWKPGDDHFTEAWI